MIEIRRMIAEGHSHKEIMDVLSLPQRSFYRYLHQAYKHDSKMPQEQNRDMLALELSVLKERLTNAYRRLATMAEDETISPRNTIEAEKAGCEVAVAIVKVQFEGPIVLKDVCAQISY
jgi:hypothetical protein